MEQSNFFEFADAGVTRLHLEHRHPLMDLRLQRFCLSLPPLPWCVKKEIARRAMSGILPEPVRKRPKTALAGSPEMELLRLPQSRWIDRFQPARELARFVDRAKVPPVCGARSDREARWRDLRPLSLDLWLRTMQAA
jgi:Asparagine synthase.